MGATGDVREVWRALASEFRWIAGVAGNHDQFGKPQELNRFRREPGVHLLDGDTAELDGLRIAGVAAGLQLLNVDARAVLLERPS